MDAQLASELAARFVCGDRLAPSEEQDLLRWLESHPAARNELLADEAIDSLLRSLGRLEGPADRFVQDALRRMAEWQVQPRDVSAAAAALPPPLLVVGPKSSAQARWRGTLLAVARGRWALAAACASAVLLVGTFAWWLVQGPGALDANRLPVAMQDNPRPDSAETNASRHEPDRAFATLAQNTGAVWDTPRAAGDRLAAGTLKLAQGKAELHFDKGTVVRLSGPAVLELCGGDEVSLQHGSLTARVPHQAVGFTVVTPLSRVVDLGTEFDVVVGESGATQTLVRQGKVSLRPQRGPEQPGKSVELAAGGLDQAAVSVPDMVAPVLPVTTVAHGAGGRFLGMVSVDGQTADFHSPEALATFQALAMKQLQSTPRRFRQQWPELVKSSSQLAKPAAKTTAAEPALETPKAPPRNSVADSSTEGGGNADAHAAPEGRSVEVKEKGKTISISDTKESGITVTVTEMVNGKKKTTQVKATTAAELARKNPDAHRWYREYLHPRPKTGKAK